MDRAEINKEAEKEEEVMGPFFNYIIMGLYLINSVWWGARGKWADMAYWLCAAGITATVTWGYKR